MKDIENLCVRPPHLAVIAAVRRLRGGDLFIYKRPIALLFLERFSLCISVCPEPVLVNSIVFLV